MQQYLTVAFWQGFWQDVLRSVATRGFRLILILVLYWIGRQLMNRIIDASLARLMARHAARNGGEDRKHRLLTLQGIVKSVVGYLLIFLLVVTVLQAVTVDVTGLITTAGIGGIAIGFGAQKLVKDVFSGFFLIIEDQFAVGDYVTVGPASGTVEEIGMRIIRIRDDSGRLWIIANGDINVVTNHSRAPVESFVEIGIAPSADVKEAVRILDDAGLEYAMDPNSLLLRPPKVLGIAGYDAGHTIIRVQIVAEPRSLTDAQLRAREFLRQRLIDGGIAVG